jgi:alpha-galactosidase
VSPFSFRVGEELSGDLLAKWNKKMDHRNLDAYRLQHRLSFTDPRTGLEVRCEAVEYLDFPVVEWTLYFISFG